MLKKFKVNETGFTLIELLIVIVIIGILAGVVIGVLNPVQQQNRARDASMQSSINKMALATKSLFVSSPRTNDRSPTHAEFANGVGNYVAATMAGTTDCLASTNAAGDAAADCHFLVEGLTLPDNCDSVYGGASATGATQCHFVYWRDSVTGGGNDEFRIAVRGSARPERLFVFRYLEDQTAGGSVEENFFTCPADEAIDTVIGTLQTDCDALN